MRVWLTVLGLVVFAVVGAATIWWYFASSLGERQLLSAQERLAKQGYVLKFGKVERSGFPVRLEWVLRDVSIETVAQSSRPRAGMGHPAARGQIDVLRFSAKPWAPQRLAYVADGRHIWHVDSQGDAGWLEIVIAETAGTLRPRDGEAGWFLDAQLRHVEAQSEKPGTPPLLVDTVGVAVEMPLSMDAMDVEARVRDVVLPLETYLGKALQSAAVTARIQPLPQGFSAGDLRAWRGRSGLVTVRDASLHFGPVQGSAGGALGLDAALRGEGNVNLRVREPNRLIAVGIEAGWIEERQRPMLNFALGLFARRNVSGSPEVLLPLNLRDGGLWLGPVRLTDLPPVVTD